MTSDPQDRMARFVDSVFQTTDEERLDCDLEDLDLDLLAAYVEGNVTPAQRERCEEILARSPAALELVADLWKSQQAESGQRQSDIERVSGSQSPATEEPAIRFIFRRRALADAPGGGELFLTPSGSDARRELAKQALERGPGGFRQGAGPVRYIVLPDVPTLDDMLAAEFVLRRLRGQALPPGALAFARYAGICREGLRPGDVPVERSLEGVYQAILNNAGQDLTSPAVREQFLNDWGRLAQRVLDAAERQTDPFTTLLFDDSEFARERAFLARDRDVYDQDVARGERWSILLTADKQHGAGLLLRRPKSMLFKYWSRSDPDAPGGRGYLFLGVQWNRTEWVFSTDPVQRLSLQPLAQLLQAAETSAEPATTAADPWFDGRPFAHSLIASPRRGTALSEGEVEQIVKRWLHAVPAEADRRPRAAAAAPDAASSDILTYDQRLSACLLPDRAGVDGGEGFEWGFGQ